MIKIVRKNPKSKVKRKNPSFYKYGYHITSNYNLDSILDYGFKRKSGGDRYGNDSFKIAELIYNNKIPIYFLTTPSLKYLTPTFKAAFYEDKDNISMLKVDIEKFNHLPDIDYLLMDENYKFIFEDYNRNPLRPVLGDECIDFTRKYKGWWKIGAATSKDIPVRLKPWVSKQGCVPITEFKNDPKLTMAMIATTHTLCIAEDIPSKYIMDVLDLKGKDLKEINSIVNKYFDY